MGVGDEVVARWVVVLANILIKSGGLLVLALLGTYVAKRARPAARAAWLESGLAALVLLPVLAVVVPGWSLNIMPPKGPTTPASIEIAADAEAVGAAAVIAEGESAGARTDTSIGAARERATFDPEAAGTRRGEPTGRFQHERAHEAGDRPALIAEGEGIAAVEASDSPDEAAGPAAVGGVEAAGGRRRVGWPAAALALYAGGVILLLAQLSFRLAGVRRWRRQSKAVTDARVLMRVEAWRRRLGIKRRVQVVTNGRIKVPTTFGWFGPTVALQEGLFEEGKEDLLDAALAHELAHVRRGDLWWALADRLVACFYWPNFLVWVALGAMTALREQACDDWCASVTGRPREYCESLRRIAEMARRGVLRGFSASMARKPEIAERLGRLARMTKGPDPRLTRRHWAAIAVAAALLCAGVAPGRLGTRRADAEETPAASAEAKGAAGVEAAAGRMLEANPETLAGVLAQAKPGDTILLADGTYSAALYVTLTGEKYLPITIKAKGNDAVFTGPDGALQLIDSKWVIVDGIRCEDSGRIGVYVAGSENCTLRNVKVSNSSSKGVHIAESSYVTLEKCEVFGGKSHGVGLYGPTDHVTIRGCRIHDNQGSGIQTNSEGTPGADVSFVVIEDNLISRNGEPIGGAAMNLADVQDAIVRNNLVYKNFKGGIVLFRGSPEDTNERNKVVGNTVYFEPGVGFYAFKLMEGCSDTYVRNNIFWGGKDGAVTVGEDSFGGLDWDYNVIGNWEGMTLIGEKSPGEEGYEYTLGQWRFDKGLDQHSVFQEDPQFVSVADDDYRLKEGSPAVDAGGEVAALDERDIAGTARPAGAGYDCGAYESSGAAAAKGKQIEADPSNFKEMVAKLAPGDTLLLADGEYGGDHDVSLTGEKGAWITIKGKGDATLRSSARQGGQASLRSTSGAKFSGGTTSLTLHDSKYVALEGLEFVDAKEYGVHLVNTENCAVRNSAASGNGAYGAFIDKSNYATVERSDFSKNGRHGMRLAVSDHAVIRGNNIHDNPSCGVLADPGEVEGPITFALVEGNVVARNGARGGGAALNMTNVCDSIVRNNLIYGNTKSGITFFADTEGYRNERNKIVGNTVYFGPGEGSYGLRVVNGAVDFYIHNNIFWGAQFGTACVYPDSFAGLDMDYNLIGNWEGQVLIGDQSPGEEGLVFTPSQWQYEKGFDKNSIFMTDPHFESAEKDNYRLISSSPAIDAGGRETVLCPADIERTARPQGMGFDIGCYEYVGKSTAAALAAAPARTLGLDIRDEETGAGIAGAQLEVQTGARRFEATTDKEGRFEADMPAGTDYMKVTVRSAGYVPMALVWDEAAGTKVPEKYTLQMPKATTIGGTVKTTEGAALGGATVIVSVPEGEGVEQTAVKGFKVETDAEGKWKCDVIPPDAKEISVDVVHPEYVLDKTAAAPALEALREGRAEAVLRPKYRLEVMLVNESGEGVEGTVTLGRDVYMYTPKTLKTDRNGRVVFDDAGKASDFMTVTAAGYAPHAEEVAIAKGMAPVKVTLEKGRHLRARVVDGDGKAMEGATVSLEKWRGENTVRWYAQADKEGRVEWKDAPTDSFSVSASKQGYLTKGGQEILPTDEEKVITLFPLPSLRGTVTDAETGEKVATFKAITGQEPANWNQIYWERDGTAEGKDGEYRIAQPFRTNFGDEVLGRYVKVEARGYKTKTQQVEIGDESIVVDFALEKEVGIVGTARHSDGTAATDATAVLATVSSSIYIGDLDLSRSEYPTCHTDEKGEFWFAAQTESYAIAVVSDKEFGEASKEELEASHEIVLSPFGRAVGQVNVGGKPGNKARVTLGRGGQYSSNEAHITWHYQTESDANGKFTFERVVPGRWTASREILTQVSGGNYWTSFNPEGAVIEVKGGETTEVVLGAGGRVVFGRMALPAESGTSVDLQESQAWMRPAPPKDAIPKEVNMKDYNAYQSWAYQWEQSDEGKAYMLGRRTFGTRLASDGAFRFENVPAGSYFVGAQISTQRGGQRYGGSSYMSKRIEIAEGEGDAAIDLGVLRSRQTGPLRAGEAALDFAVTLVDGGTARLADYQGKFLVLYFWSSQNRACRAGIKTLKTLWEEVGQDGRLAILGLSVDEDVEGLKKYLSDNNLPWSQAAIGSINEAEAAQEYGVTGVPMVFLVGPDGAVIEGDVSLAGINATVRKAMGVAAKEEAQPKEEKPKAGAPPAAGGVGAVGAPAGTQEAKAREVPRDRWLVAVLDDADREYSGKAKYEDTLTLYSTGGEVLWNIGGLNSCQTCGGAHSVVWNEADGSLWSTELVSKRLMKVAPSGKMLLEKPGLKAHAMAVDGKTGDVWCLTQEGTIYGSGLIVLDKEGNAKGNSPLPILGFDIVYSNHDDCFWAVGKKVLKLDREGKVVWESPEVAWLMVSVAVNEKDGSVWVAEREHPQVGGSKNRLWVYEPDGKLRKEIDLGKRGWGPVAVAVDSERGAVWVGTGKGLLKLNLDGEVMREIEVTAFTLAVEGETGDVWAAGEEGVYKLNSEGDVVWLEATPGGSEKWVCVVPPKK